MALSLTGQKVLEKLQNQPRLSSVGSKAITQSNYKAEGASLLMPDFATSESTNDGTQGRVTPNDMFIGNLPKTVFRGATRGAMSAGMAVGEWITDKEDTAFVNDTRIKRFIFGKEPITLKSELVDPLVEFGASERAAKNAAPFLAVALTGLDIAGFGSGTAAKTIIKNLVKATDPGDIATIMKGMGYGDNEIVEFGVSFGKATTEKEVVDLLDKASTLKKRNEVMLKVADDSEPITVGGKVFSDAVKQTRETAVKLVNEVGDAIPKTIRTSVLRKETPTLGDFFEVTKALDEIGIDVTALRKSVDDLAKTVDTEPERFGLDVGYKKTGDVPVSDGLPAPRQGDVLKKTSLDSEVPETIPVKDARYTTAGELDIELIPDGGKVEFKDNTFIKQGDVFVKEIKSEGAGKVKDNTFTKQGEVFVQGVKQGDSTEVAINDARYPTSGSVPVVESKVKPPKIELKADKLDEVADPLREDLGRVSTDVQTRYGVGAVTKNTAPVFKKNETAVASQLRKYLSTPMSNHIPDWVPDAARSQNVMQEVLDILDQGLTPTVHGTPHMELYTAMVDETARRSGAFKKGPKPAVDPVGAVLQSTRERLTPVGKTTAKVEPGIPAKETLETNVWDDAGPYKEKMSQDEAYDDYSSMMYAENKAKLKPSDTKSDFIKNEGITFEKDVDTTAFTGGFNDVFRISEKVFGESWGKVKAAVFDKFDDAKFGYVSDVKDRTSALSENITNGLKIHKGSKESAAVMDLGEGVITYDQVVAKFGAKRAEDIKKAAEWFRTEYDQMIKTLNVNRGPDNQINPRQHYFRHYQEMGGFGALKNDFEDVGLGNLVTRLFRPKENVQSITKERFFGAYKHDAVGGFIDYIPQYAYEKNINPQIRRINDFIDQLQKSKAPQGYVNFMKTWSADLAGSINPFDSAFEIVPGGRGTIETLNYFNNRAKRNAILGNVGSGIAQAFNIPNGVAYAGPRHSLNGIKRTLADAVGMNQNSAWKKSSFISERYVNDNYREFSRGFWEKGVDKAAFIITVMDEFGTKFIWNSLYEKALREGMPDAVRYADEFTRKSVGGRGIGEVPIVQKSKVFQMIAPFQLEVVNALRVQKGFIDDKAFGKLMTLYATAYLMNQAANEAMGRDVSFNPVDALVDAYGLAADDSFSAKDRAVSVGGRLAGEALIAIPMGGYVATAGQWAMGWDEEKRKEFFGKEGDPAKYGNAPLLVNAIMDPVFSLLPPFGGKQAKNTIDGVGHLSEANPDPMIEPGAPGAIRNVLFGKWTPNIKYEADLEKEMESLYNENFVLVNSGDPDKAAQAQVNVDKLPDNIWPIYKRVADAGRIKEENRKIQAMQPTMRVVDALLAEKKEAEAQAIVEQMSEEEWKVYSAARKAERTKAWEIKKEEELNPEWKIKEAIDYAYAFGTNPVQAYNIMFVNKEHIEDTVGGVFDGVVRTRRITEDESSAVKNDLGFKKGSGQILEHKLPLGLGGSNLRDNLELVEGDIHDSWTPVENYLIKAVKNKEINYVEAQELILRHKGYEGEPITFEEIKAIINKE